MRPDVPGAPDPAPATVSDEVDRRSFPSDGRGNLINLCMVGHGMMGVWHSEALAGTECRLHTIVGRRAEPTAEFAARYGYRRWTLDYGAALADPEVDAVLVAGPSETHAPMARAALEKGKHVLVEIPIAMNHADAVDLVDLAEARGLVLGVVHPMRFRKEHVELVERLRTGEERLRHVHARMFTHRLENVGATGYRRSWTDDILWHHGAHLVDVGLWLAGAGDPAAALDDVSSLSAYLPAPDEGMGIPMEFMALAGLAGDRSIMCSASYYCRERIFDVFAVTNRNSYRLDILDGSIVVADARTTVASEQDNNAQVARDFVEAIRQGRQTRVPGRSVLPAMRLLQRVQDDFVGVPIAKEVSVA